MIEPFLVYIIALSCLAKLRELPFIDFFMLALRSFSLVDNQTRQSKGREVDGFVNIGRCHSYLSAGITLLKSLKTDARV